MAIVTALEVNGGTVQRHFAARGNGHAEKHDANVGKFTTFDFKGMECVVIKFECSAAAVVSIVRYPYNTLQHSCVGRQNNTVPKPLRVTNKSCDIGLDRYFIPKQKTAI